ncbi:MAG: TRAP transporter small permease [Pseudolabrys sp.]|nr:TRAP transporter small permease [Pseudolabrys sp.]MSP32376.1 TRAP transporter small permease [Pseudolabrys sp.]
MFHILNARIVRVLLACAAVIIFLLGFLVCADVIGRAVFNSPVKGTPEIVSMSIVIICFLLAGYSVQSGGMICTDVFSGMFGLRGLAFAQLLSAVLGIVFFGFIVWGSFEPTLHAIASGEYEGEGALRVPVWPARTVVVIGAVLVVASYALHAASAIKALITGRADEVVAPAASTHL